jgi:hypothetical protein
VEGEIMRVGSGRLSALALAVMLASGSIALAQDSGAVADPVASTKTPQVAQPSEGGVNWKGVGVGAGTMAGNVLYVPAKLAYGLLGGIGGGAAWALTGGNRQVADTVWRSSLGGDYILTPDMIQGKERVHFTGPTNTAPEADSSDAAAPGSSANLASAGPSASSSYKPMGASSSLSSTSVSPSASTALGGTHPIDTGAGPVRGSSSTSSYSALSTSTYKAPTSTSSSSYSSTGSAASVPKLSTSIE